MLDIEATRIILTRWRITKVLARTTDLSWNIIFIKCDYISEFKIICSNVEIKEGLSS